MLPEWEDLREHASEIKEHTLTHLADYLEEFARNLESNGVIVHWAKDAQEFNEIAYSILAEHNVKKLVKSKSMLTEECEMNKYLIAKGIDVVRNRLWVSRIFAADELKTCTHSGSMQLILHAMKLG